MSEAPAAPQHVEDTVQAIMCLHDEHQDRATPADRAFARATAAIASPAAIMGVAVAGLGWIAVNLALPAWGMRAIDPAPFEWLQGVATLLALFATVLILNTQRRDDQIAVEREQLALQLAMLNDRKLAKLIALVEELRRDDPTMRDRIDPEAEAMAQPADPRVVLDAMRPV